MTRGDLLLVGFIFGLIYISGLLPKIAARIAGEGDDAKPVRPKGE